MTWVKIYRKFIEWEWYDNSKMVHLFLHLLLKANHKKNTWHGIEIKRGELLTGINSLCRQTKMTPRNIRTCLTNLKSTNEITIKATNKFSIITLCNYNEYQKNDKQNDKQNDKRATNERQ